MLASGRYSDDGRFSLPGGAQHPTASRTSRVQAAVLAADVVAYTSLMEEDEEDTYSRLKTISLKLLAPCVSAHHGRIVKNTGDGFIARIETAGDAVLCALALQSHLVDAAADFPLDKRIFFRMAVHFCKLIDDGQDVYGEGVNIAARLMAYAEPGDIVLSESTYKLVIDQLALYPTFPMGALHLKNIRKPVPAVGIRIGSARNLGAPTIRGAIDPRPSIAVLPFDTADLGPGRDLYADALVEEIIHALATVKDLVVISRSSTLRFTGHLADLAEIGRTLGVRYLLRGSLRSNGPDVRTLTELSDVESGRVIRSDHHDGGIGDLFDVQSDIAMSATRVIAPDIQEWELRRAMRKHPESLTAYDMVLQARRHLYRLDNESHAKARGLLQQALALEPDYAPAYSYMAYWHIFRVGEGLSTDPNADSVEAARAARAAIDRDDKDALAIAIYGHVQSFLLRDYRAGLAHFDRAIEVGPSCPEAWSMSSLTCGYLGDAKSAVERATYGLRLSPLDAHLYYKQSALAQAYYVAEQYEAAVVWARKAQVQNRSVMFNNRLLAASLAALDRTSEAHVVATEILSRAADFRLGAYARHCPFQREAKEVWIERLRRAGLPD